MLGPITLKSAGPKKQLSAVIFNNFAHDTVHLLVENKTTQAGATILLIRDTESGQVEVGRIDLGRAAAAMFSVGPNCDRVQVKGINRDGPMRIQVSSEAGGPLA